MRHGAKSVRKFSIMSKVVLFLFGSLLVCVVYSADVAEVLKGSIDYIINNANGDSKSSAWTYVCDDVCVRKEFDDSSDTKRISIETCNMLCGELPLWPKPAYTEVTNKDYSAFSKNRVVIKLNATDEIKNDLKQASNIFMENLPATEDYLMDYGDITLFNIVVNVTGNESVLKVSTVETYYLTVTKSGENIEVTIIANTYFGARHGLETLSQLIWLDADKEKLNIIHDVVINDKPKFPHRGLMVDTARNYFYVDQLKKVLDGMAAAKLNVFHLHLTDASSFPIVLPSNELFAKFGAYSPEMVYTQDDIKELIEYARIRGIRVILEVDAPSHLNQDLNKAKEGLVICGEDAIFNGHLNPDNDESLEVLKDIYKDLLQLGTDSDMFHIGGDEVNLTCWQQNALKDIKLKPGAHRYQVDTMSMWADFTNSMFDSLYSANDDELPQYVVVWSSDLTSYHIQQLKHKENVVVQYWYGSIESILANGNKVIFSTVGRWYLDCGYGSWKTEKDEGSCDPYTTWHTFYKYRPWEDEFPSHKEQVLGGEACLWSETVEIDTLETRIWPRAAAVAERLWNDPDDFDRNGVYMRLDIHRQRLENRGIKSEAIWPRWCYQNPGRC